MGEFMGVASEEAQMNANKMSEPIITGLSQVSNIIVQLANTRKIPISTSINLYRSITTQNHYHPRSISCSISVPPKYDHGSSSINQIHDHHHPGSISKYHRGNRSQDHHHPGSISFLSLYPQSIILGPNRPVMTHDHHHPRSISILSLYPEMSSLVVID